MLAGASPQEGQHHDLFNMEVFFEELWLMRTKAGIHIKGLFLNADAGFDAQVLRDTGKEKEMEANIAGNPRNETTETVDYQYFDEQLYKYRTVIEQANAWMDSFKAILIRFEKKASNWVAIFLLAFSVRFLRRIKQKKKS
jgi:uncharacterized membrane protein